MAEKTALELMSEGAQGNAPAVNPSEQAALESTAHGVTVANRVPMDVPQRKLEVPQIPGYFTYWHLDSNVPTAIMGGYEFVESRELNLNQLNVATAGNISGNEDLGSRVKRMGGVNQFGQAEYLNLMKLRMEWRLADLSKKNARNAAILQGIFKQERILDREGDQVAADVSRTRYVKQEHVSLQVPLFSRPVMKRP